MSASTLDCLVSLMEAKGWGVGGTTIFKTSAAGMPPGAGPFINLIQAGGEPPRGTHNAGMTAYRKPRVQIVVVGKDANAVEALMDRINEGIETVNETIRGVPFLKIAPVTEPMDLGPDGSGRPQLKLHVACERRG